MFLKKDKTFLGKNILRFVKQPNGSIAIIVLIIGIAIVLAVSALSAYMIKDIKFTQIDEQKLKALNIAEAGISNMYLNLDKFYNGDISGLKPPLPGDYDGIVYKYHGELKDGTEVLGTYYVEYAPYSTNSIFSGYIINSKGVDLKSQTARKVGVKINIVPPDLSSGIYDYIYTGQSSVFQHNGTVIDGPFYTEGDLTITNGAGMLQTNNKGPVVIKGNLTVDGDASLISESLLIGGNVLLKNSAKIKGGPVSIAGNLNMSGDSRIGDPLISPMIVMGNIDMGTIGSAQIGMLGVNLVLSCQGTVIKPGSAHIYATRNNSLKYTFPDPLFNVVSLVDNYYRTAVQSSALIITGNLRLDDSHPCTSPIGVNSLSFKKQPDGTGLLNIEGNVIINGSLTIGNNGNDSLSKIIYYTGSGIIYASDNIFTYAKLIPLPLNDFPTANLLVFISEKNINFDIYKFWLTNPDCASANIYTVGIAKGNISLLHGTVKGTLIAGGSLIIDKDFGKVCYEETISQNLPPELPNNTSGSANTTFTQIQWQELTP